MKPFFYFMTWDNSLVAHHAGKVGIVFALEVKGKRPL